MNPDFLQTMRNAVRLTRSGDLQAATAAIQAALSGKAAASPAPDAAPFAPSDRDVIDVAAREVPDAARTSSPTTTAESFTAGSHSEGAIGRDYKLYTPPGAGERALPLLVMLHGCTQNPDDFATGTAMNTLARAQGFYVLYPAQSRQANPQRCWNWFKHNHQQRGRGEPALLAGMTREVMARCNVDPDRVYVAGLSAGGAMAAILGDTYPDLFAAVGVHSGLATSAATDLPSALGAMKSGSGKARTQASGVPTIVFHGDADGTVHPGNGAQVIAASVGRTGAPASDQVKTPGGRSSTRHVYRNTEGEVIAEHWLVHGTAHAWSGGSTQGSYTDARGPDASAEMLRFFMAHPRRKTH